MSHPSYYATSGKKVAENFLPFLFNYKIIPFFPIYQSYAPKSGIKLMRNETPTFRFGNSSILIGSNLSSSNAETKAY